MISQEFRPSNRIPWKPALWVLSAGLLLAACGSSQEAFVGRIVDAETGEPVAASVAISTGGGEAVEIEGEHGHVEYLDRRWCYVDGEFTLSELDPEISSLTVEVRGGPETLTLKEGVELPSAGRDFPLRRWVRMAEEGYVSGDGHVHYLALGESHLQMRAEGLNVLNLLTSDFTGDVEKFSGKLDPVSSHEHSVWVGQEMRDWQQGHINLLGISKLVDPLEPFGGRFGDRSERNLLLAPAMRVVQRDGGAVAWAHFSNLPGAESPIAFALGLVDAVELIAYDDPTELPSHWWPWQGSGMSQSEFPVKRGMDLYYEYLNAGLRLPITAGTDKMGENIPVGSNRLYARYEEEPSYGEWLEGMKAGNGFVTNGPILTFEVDGATMGDVLEFSEPRTVSIRAAASSPLPFSSLEIVRNGEVVGIAREPETGTDGIFRVRYEGEFPLDESSWFAARVARPTAARRRILPRGLTVFAHTNPVYFLRDGRRIRHEASIRYLETYIRGTLNWLENGAQFESEAVRREAIRMAQEALRFYESL